MSSVEDLKKMKENHVDLNFESDLPGNKLAAALRKNNKEDSFISKNQLFDMIFKDINTPQDLHNNITNKT